jgi:hypothetical protein
MTMDRWVKDLLERQAAWQRNRSSLPWEEKLRQSLVMREAQRSLRGATTKETPVKEAGRTLRREPPG